MYAPPQYKELDMRSKQPQYQRFLSGVQTETDPNKQNNGERKLPWRRSVRRKEIPGVVGYHMCLTHTRSPVRT
jgi:hypothetical protein